MTGRRFARRGSAALFALVVSLALLRVVTPNAALAAENGTSIGGSLVILGASVTSPSRATRTLNSDQAAAFMQTWLPSSIFGKVANENPPKGLRVSRVSVRYTYAGADEKPMLIFYASDGQVAWVGMPPQSLWPGAAVTSERWIRAPDSGRTMAAIAGRLSAIPRPESPSTTVPPSQATANRRPTGSGK